jgi:hypothetical protein
MKPNISRTLGLVAGTNVLVFCQSPEEPSFIFPPLNRHVGNASVHPFLLMLGFISFRPSYRAENYGVYG